tara:strand:+ start:714 stop:2246 length:1533 start_codon:yes stop_codon:yes gene_type:complete
MYIGSNIVTDGLVFGYDSYYGGIQGAPTRFYKGEPTANLVPSSHHNGRFTTSNSWGTYNTNQYNSNNYFDIGTISGVSNNIVTLSSVGHNIRSFDVLRPQTTGGGVTAGTDYVVKKITNNTFSLHAYNSNQSGAQGYINTATNFYKVHDAYANDTRVSINATNFPDMWWGAPHLPNSGLIKEIVPGAGYVKGTNALRLHVYRGDGVADGMAYNVYTPVTQGDVITVSFWVRPTNSHGYGKTLNYQTYFGSGNSASSFTTTLNSDGEWQHIVHQWTASVTYSFYSYWFPQGSSDKYAIDLADFQVEVNKSHVTPFVAGTRSATDSLIDLKRTKTLDLSNVSFSSTAQPTFDGTDDHIALGASSQFNISRNVTIESLVKRDSGGWNGIFGRSDGGSFIHFQLYGETVNLYFYGPSLACVTGNVITSTSRFYHIVASFDGTSAKIYVNGVLNTTTTTSSLANISSADNVSVGKVYSSGRHFDGEIPVLKVYNKTLTSSEILQSYKTYKKRFNI